MLLNNDEHRIKMDKIYADAEEFMNKEYSKPLNDEEVILLYGLFERAKRDDRFKDGLKDIRLTDINYESIFATIRMMDEQSKKVNESCVKLVVQDAWIRGKAGIPLNEKYEFDDKKGCVDGD